MALEGVGGDSRLMGGLESSVDEGSALTGACSSCSADSIFTSSGSAGRLGLSLNGSSFNGGSRLMDTCSSFSDGSGIDGVGKSL